MVLSVSRWHIKTLRLELTHFPKRHKRTRIFHGTLNKICINVFDRRCWVFRKVVREYAEALGVEWIHTADGKSRRKMCDHQPMYQGQIILLEGDSNKHKVLYIDSPFVVTESTGYANDYEYVQVYDMRRHKFIY